MSIIHYMTAGRATCGLPGLPSDWPAEHLWAGEWEHVTCQACLAVREKEKDDLLKVDLSKPKPRAPSEKRKEPCYEDDDLMPFGRYRDELMSDVPAAYLHWLWTQRPISDKKLENYIFNNINHLKKEHPDGIWT